MNADAAASIDARTPTPAPHVNVRVAVLAAGAAAAFYVVAVFANEGPPPAVAGVIFAATPAFAALALAVIRARSRSEPSRALDWFATGLTVAIVAMVLQVASFPALAPGGGLLGTSTSANGALFLLFHVAAAGGMLLGAAGAPRSWQRPFTLGGILLSFAVAADLLPVPALFDAAGRHTRALLVADLAVAALTATATVAWIVRSGRTPRPLVGWVGVSQSLATYELLLHTVAQQRLTPVWWASVSMRLAAYAVLAIGAVATVLHQLRRWEQYTESELDRREGQLTESLATVQRLLAQATEASSALQEQLLPPRLSVPAGMQVVGRYRGAGAHDEIGGDWYDTVLLPHGGVALVIGDVEGHDLTAAALMGQVRAAVRSYAMEGHSPAVLLRRVNGFLLASGIERLISMAYVEVYPHEREAILALAGHPPPLLVPLDGGPLVLVEADIGVPLGLDADQAWQERTVSIPADVSVVLYTDGLVQSSGAEEQYVRLLRAAAQAASAPLEELADALVDAVDGPGRDDVAVLAARLTARPQPAAEGAVPAQPTSEPQGPPVIRRRR